MPTKPVSLRGVSCIAWNKDCSMIALSPNNEEVHIYSTNGSKDSAKWDSKPKYVLNDHSEVVSCIDWSPATGFLVTCSHDRNAYVWKFDPSNDKWEPSLVLLRINRAANMCKWSPLGNKFAVASSAKVVPICTYEEKHNWWVSKAIKKHKSTVLAVAWCPNNKFIVTGSTDYRCRIISAYLEPLDSSEDPHGFGEIFKKQHSFGEVLAEFDQAKAWVHDVAWSPNGFRLAFLGHGSTIHFVQITGDGPPEVQTIKQSGLPYLAVEFISNKAVVVAGFDNNPHIYAASKAMDPEMDWKFVDKVDKEVKKEKTTKSKFAKAASIFESIIIAQAAEFLRTPSGTATRGESQATATTVNTVHKNTILKIAPFFGTSELASEISTAGIDGRVVYWSLKSAGFDLNALQDEE